MAASVKTFRDAVLGDIRFDADELALIDTPAVQRLRGIKQLGASHLVFPSAVHTRFEHSLGTCWLAKRLIDALQSHGRSIDPEHARAVRLASLLHDITHVPFGHTFEDERRLFDRHDEDDVRLASFLDSPAVAAGLRRSGVGDLVHALISPRPLPAGVPGYLRDLVTGTICADLLDYLRRDAFFCGLSLQYDDRLFHYFDVADQRLVVRLHKGGGFRRDALSELIHLLQMRYTLTERVYYHHAKVIAGAMISRALELAMEAGVFDPKLLLSLRDDSFLDRLTEAARPLPGLNELTDDIAGRRLYKRVYFLTTAAFGRRGLDAPTRDFLADRFHHDVAARRQFERRLADELGIPEAHVIVYCPSPKMQLKEANVLAQVGPDECRPLSALGHPDVEALKEKHRGLWRFYVLLRRDHPDRFAEAGDRCESWIGQPNQLDPTRFGPLAFGRGR